MKGHIERVWRTSQDRLVSEPRMAHACGLDCANLARCLGLRYQCVVGADYVVT